MLGYWIHLPRGADRYLHHGSRLALNIWRFFRTETCVAQHAMGCLVLHYEYLHVATCHEGGECAPHVSLRSTLLEARLR